MSATTVEAEAEAQTQNNSETTQSRQPAIYALPSTIRGVNHTFPDPTVDEDSDLNAPNIALLPDGRRAGRVVVAGVLRSVEDVSSAGKQPYLKARISAGGADTFVMAGQYQPDVRAQLMKFDEEHDLSIEPVFVSVSGKIRTYSPDDTDATYANIRPEMLTEISMNAYTNWEKNAVDDAVEATLDLQARLNSGSNDEDLMLWRSQHSEEQLESIAADINEGVLNR